MARRPPRPKTSPRLRSRLRCETLEDRRLLATYVVSSTADAGAGSLREAIGLANATVGVADEIVFDATMFSAPQAILLNSELPTIRDSLSIVGPGAELLALDGQHGANRTPRNGDGWRLFGVASSAGQVSIRDLTIRNFDRSGAIGNSANLTVSSVVLVGNYSTSSGGAIGNSGDLRLIDTLFEGNRAVDGGAISNGRTLSIENTVFRDNEATRNGGAILNSSRATISDTLFESNWSGSSGGAVSSFSTLGSGQITIQRSSFVNNESSGEYGAAFLSNGVTASLVLGSTFSGNQGTYAGALGTIAGFTMRNSTVVNTLVTGSSGAAIGGIEVGRPIFDHTVIADTWHVTSTNQKYRVPDLAYAYSVTNSIIGYDDQGLVDGANGNRIGGIGSNRIDPRLGPLAMNGGRTPTHAPLPGSIVINAGNAAFVAAPGETDQRGGPYQRVVGGRIDIGAYESQGEVNAAAGDFNGDGRFDAADYSVWRDSVGTTVAPLTAGDATGDGVVDETDRALWASRHGDRYVPRVVVNSLADDNDSDIYNGRTTLREAINFTNAEAWADRITFDPSLSGGVIHVASTPYTGNLRLSGHYQIEAGLTIDASMLPEGITLDAGGRTNGLHIYSLTAYDDNIFDVTFVGLTVKNGLGLFGGGGAVNSLMYGKLTLIDCELINSTSGSNSGAGGAIYAHGPVELVDTVIDTAKSYTSGRDSSGSGSAIYAVGDVSLLRSHLRNVTTVGLEGAAIAASPYRIWHAGTQRIFPSPSVTLVDSSISNAAGGGIQAPGNVTLTNSTVEGPTGFGVLSGRRGLYLDTSVGGNVSLTDSVVRGFVSALGVSLNTGFSSGAGVVARGNVSLVRSRVEDNKILNFSSSFTRGGGVYAHGTVSLLDSAVDRNSTANGGGIYAEGFVIGTTGTPLPAETTVVSIVGSTVHGNLATRTGAAIWTRGRVAIEASSISENAATGINSFDSYPPSIVFIDNPSSFVPHTVTFTDVVLANNTSFTAFNPALPPAAYVLAGYGPNPVNATLIRTQVLDNQMNGVSARSIVDSVIRGNTGYGASVTEEVRGSAISDNRDGGLLGRSSTLVIRDSSITGNSSTIVTLPLATAGVGGQFAAGVSSGGAVVLERTLVADNHLSFLPASPGTTLVAGGIRAASLVSIDSTIRDNSVEGAGVVGGGVAVTGAGGARLYRSTVSGNGAIGAGARGGGVFGATVVELVQSTVSGNGAEGDGALGGGVYTSSLLATHSTIAGNASTSQGGGAYAIGSITFEGVILAGNTAGIGPDLYRAGTDPLTVNYSLIGDVTDSGVDEATGVGNLLGVDPLLGPLADNGGPTWTHALLAGSPAIDAGDPARTGVPWSSPSVAGFPIVSFPGDVDQRGVGFGRLLDGGSGALRIDLGAVEAAIEAPELIVCFVKASAEGEGNPSLAPEAETLDDAFADRDARGLLLLQSVGPVDESESSDDPLSPLGPAETPDAPRDEAFALALGW